MKMWGREREDVGSSEVRCEAVRVKVWGRQSEDVGSSEV